MEIKLFHDLSSQEITAGFAKNLDGCFYSTLWHIRRPDVYEYVQKVALAGGIKKLYNIDPNVITIYGADRLLVPKNGETEARFFIRDAIENLKEAVVFNPDIIQMLDVPLDDDDSEKAIIEKLAINRDVAMRTNQWLIKHKLRSSRRYKKSNLPCESKFMLLAVCHGDNADAYADEAKYMIKNGYADVIGVPIAGLLSKVQGLNMNQRYDYVIQVMGKVLDEVGNSRPVQMMGYGLSRISELSKILGLAKKYDASIWLESSTIIRNSVHARKLLSIHENSDYIDYVNTARVKGAEGMTTLQVFQENNKILKAIIDAAVAQVKF